MITLIGRWEKDWLDPKIEAFMWKQLCNAYKVDRLIMIPKLLPKRTSLDQYDTIEEALKTVSGEVVALEPNGDLDLNNFKHSENAVYVFGNAKMSNKFIIKKQVSINTPQKTDMFAVNAAAIVLESRR